MKLLNTLHRVQQIAEDAFRVAAGDLDITPRQAAVLAAIEAQPDCSQAAVVLATNIDRSTLADICRRLARKGWLSRRRSKKDGRAMVLALTEEGAATLRAARKAAAAAEHALPRRIQGLGGLGVVEAGAGAPVGREAAE